MRPSIIRVKFQDRKLTRLYTLLCCINILNLSAIEQEEALNAEKEMREAREAKTRGIKKSYAEV